MSKNYYDLLKVHRNATEEEIRKAYKKAALVHHPDKGGEEEMFKKVTLAHTILSDAKQRTNYNRECERTGSYDGMRQQRSQPEDAKRASQERTRKQTRQNSQTGAVEIPPNPETLSIKELKNLLVSLNIAHDDCFEKQDLIDRLKQRKTAPRKTTQKAPGAQSTAGAAPRAQPRAAPVQTRNDMSIKILSVGDPEVGKSCLIKRYCEGRFVQRYISTIGIDYGVKKINMQGKKVSVNFFDLSGNSDYTDIRNEFYRDSQGVIMVFETCTKSTFQNLQRWEREMKANGCSEPAVVVCGNKADLKGKEVTPNDAQKWCNSKGYTYFEVSASTGNGVVEAFDTLFNMVVSRSIERKKNFLNSNR